MFFPEKIKSIKSKDKVLEIGPGSTPHPRSDVFLDLKILDKAEAKFQRGNRSKIIYTKPIYYYDGKTFPFRTNEFDYVICSHVLEHVSNIRQFVKEIFRVSKKGYFEFPTIIYEYLYNFDVHLNFLLYSDGSLYYLKKTSTPLDKFRSVQNVLFESLNKGHDEIVTSLIDVMAQGFEWSCEFKIIETGDINEIVPKTNIDARVSNDKGFLNILGRYLTKHEKKY